MAKQLMQNPRDCENGNDDLRNQISESGIEVGSCEPNQEMCGRRGEGINEWGVRDRILTSNLGNQDSNKGTMKEMERCYNQRTLHRSSKEQNFFSNKKINLHPPIQSYTKVLPCTRRWKQKLRVSGVES